MEKVVPTILSDFDLEKLAKEVGLIAPFEDECLSGASYDLRVGGKLSSRNRLKTFDLALSDYIVESGECVTIDTFETLNLRGQALFGVIANKHSLAALGLFHPITTVDPGFQGHLALTFFNLSNVRYTIRRGDKIAKIYFQALNSPYQREYGVNLRPSYREGATNVALIVDHPEKRDEDEELAKMYGAPISRLYKLLNLTEKQLELLALKGAKEKRDRFTQWVFTAIVALVSAFLGAYLKENWTAIFG
jgi:deoxycytidine triphosphate deaminase